MILGLSKDFIGQHNTEVCSLLLCSVASQLRQDKVTLFVATRKYMTKATFLKESFCLFGWFGL